MHRKYFFLLPTTVIIMIMIYFGCPLIFHHTLQSTQPAALTVSSSHPSLFPQHLMISSVAPITRVFISADRKLFYDRRRWWKIKLYTEINRIFHLFIHPWTSFLHGSSIISHTKKSFRISLKFFSLPSRSLSSSSSSVKILFSTHFNPLRWFLLSATAFDFARITKPFVRMKSSAQPLSTNGG